MVKRKKATKRKVKQTSTSSGDFDKESFKVDWVKVIVTLVIGGLLGMQFATSNVTMDTILLFIVLVLLVLNLAVLLDVRRYVIAANK